MHVDPLAARRTQAGSVVVHGVHALLWSLDALFAGGYVAESVAGIDVRFLKFIYLDDEVVARAARRTASVLRVELVANEIVTTTIDVRFGPPDGERFGIGGEPAAVPDEPLGLDVADLPGRAGRIAASGVPALAAMFPAASVRLGSGRVEAIARLSALVGMLCPGLHSIFSGLRVAFTSDEGDGGIGFRVDRVDERFRLVEIAVGGSGIDGVVTAFVRQPPIAQPSLRELAGRVAPGEFAGTTALVIGGSRGLGALAARTIAAGGGRVALTYLVGEREARAIHAEIGAGDCRILRYDAREDPEPQLANLEWPINQLYYFATAQIFRQKARWYVAARFAEFARVYVDGFEAACSALIARAAPLSAFYPSSVAVEQHPRDMTEYSMAKAAGEMLCADMNRFSAVRVLVARLPRILTDQTATVMPAASSDATEVMLPIIRQMRDGASAHAGG